MQGPSFRVNPHGPEPTRCLAFRASPTNFETMMKRALIPCALAAALSTGGAHAQDPHPIGLHAAGSLRDVLTEVADRFEQDSGLKVARNFGPSGLLRERIEKGEPADLFASADTSHPARLAKGGSWTEPVVFTRNMLCALAQPAVDVATDTLLDRMLDPALRLGTSTPKADPSGDYAWTLFEKAETVRAGAFATLDAKAQKLTGGPDSPKPPAGRNPYAWVMDENRADLFLTYCTNAVAARRESPKLQIIHLPPELQVGATYGMTLRADAPASARRLAEYMLSPAAQERFNHYGFGAI